VIFDDIMGLARSAGAAAEGWISPPVRLGVTGLSRAGKTVFITALVHNLLNGGRLPFLAAAAQGRLLRAYLEPQPDDAVPRFGYEEHVATLSANQPAWPESTRRISQLRLTLEYEPVTLLRRQFGTARLHVDIVDYPGEWLLDLPLLRQSYQEWSQDALAQSRDAQRQAFAAEWHGFLAGADPAAPADETAAMQGAELFIAYLRRCRADPNLLSTLTPGRMLMPGDLEGSPALTFMPLDVPLGESPPRGSLHMMMARRFEAYKTHVIQPFFRDHFARLDRQIVLVDVLSALNAGPSAMADLERAMTAVLQCFRPGANSWLSGILGKRIDRILFAATKADHIHHTSHDRLEAILRQSVQRAIDRALFAGAEVKAVALAAIRATREIEAEENGEALRCIAGIPLPGERLDGRSFDGLQEIALFPGDLPENTGDLAHRPSDRLGVRVLRFRPPAPRALGFGLSAAFPHIRLDRAIEFLIGDRLQ
jgi:predicted YcjX-like family ATPase